MTTNGNGTNGVRVVQAKIRGVQVILASFVVAVIILAFVYGLLRGLVPVPVEVQSGFWIFVSGILVLAGIAAQSWLNARNAAALATQNAANALLVQQRSDANAAATQQQVLAIGERVDVVGARVENGLGEKIVNLTLEKTTAADAIKASEAAAQQRDADFAAMKAQVVMIAQLMAERAQAPITPVTPAPVALVAPNGAPIATDLQDNTAALGDATTVIADNSDATRADTQTRLTNLEAATGLDTEPLKSEGL